jgi:hypothetical protein
MVKGGDELRAVLLVVVPLVRVRAAVAAEPPRKNLPHGFRAVLWHQGESDANRKDPARTLPGKVYREYLERLIRDTRKDLGWEEAPWLVARVSYHGPGDESSPDIRAGQAAQWKGNVTLEGPDSDALKGEFRESGGKGGHVSGPGLREHVARWVEKVGPWLERQTAGTDR